MRLPTNVSIPTRYSPFFGTGHTAAGWARLTGLVMEPRDGSVAEKRTANGTQHERDAWHCMSLALHSLDSSHAPISVASIFTVSAPAIGVMVHCI